jgi:hypothetical protein
VIKWRKFLAPLYVTRASRASGSLFCCTTDIRPRMLSVLQPGREGRGTFGLPPGRRQKICQRPANHPIAFIAQRLQPTVADLDQGAVDRDGQE